MRKKRRKKKKKRSEAYSYSRKEDRVNGGAAGKERRVKTRKGILVRDLYDRGEKKRKWREGFPPPDEGRKEGKRMGGKTISPVLSPRRREGKNKRKKISELHSRKREKRQEGMTCHPGPAKRKEKGGRL